MHPGYLRCHVNLPFKESNHGTIRRLLHLTPLASFSQWFKATNQSRLHQHSAISTFMPLHFLRYHVDSPFKQANHRTISQPLHLIVFGFIQSIIQGNQSALTSDQNSLCPRLRYLFQLPFGLPKLSIPLGFKRAQ